MKIICVGRNYAQHIDELQNERPDEPVLFTKPETAKLRTNESFYIPEFSNNVHYEVEVLIKIKKVGKHIQSKFAHKYYDQVGLGIDFTARDMQQKLKTKGLPWEKAKGFDGSAVVGPRWIYKTAIDDIQKLDFSLQRNQEVVQDGNTSMMLWKIDELISEISKFFTLKIGDVIFTGTPSGVGKVEIGDTLEGFIEDRSIFKVDVK